MEEIHNEYKDDSEAAIFYALALKSTSDPEDKNYTNERKAGKILRKYFPGPTQPSRNRPLYHT